MRPIIIACLLVTGCAQPFVTGSSPTGVTVQYDSVMNPRTAVQDRAQRECARHGKTAVYVGEDAAPPVAQYVARYDCR